MKKRSRNFLAFHELSLFHKFLLFLGLKVKVNIITFSLRDNPKYKNSFDTFILCCPSIITLEMINIYSIGLGPMIKWDTIYIDKSNRSDYTKDKLMEIYDAC